jgi:hypothetical protein
VLALQVQQGRFHRGHGVDGGAQIEGLQAAAAAVAVGKARAHAVQDGLQVADGLAFDQGAGIFQRLADFFAARHFADAGVAAAVLHDQQVAGEERPPCAPDRFSNMLSQVTGAGLNSTRALCSFQCSAQVFLRPLATSSIR